MGSGVGEHEIVYREGCSEFKRPWAASTKGRGEFEARHAHGSAKVNLVDSSDYMMEVRANSEPTRMPNVLGKDSRWSPMSSANLGGHRCVRQPAGDYCCEFRRLSGLNSTTTFYQGAMRLIQCANSNLMPTKVGSRETSSSRGPGSYCLH